jgi:glycosyltransferase involved in cell wall biosynthesis
VDDFFAAKQSPVVTIDEAADLPKNVCLSFGDALSVQRNYRVLSVLMPAYNESRTLRTIVKRVLSVSLPMEIELIIVDDCSKDATQQIAEELAAADPRIKYIRKPVNEGKGAAIHTAIAAMTGDIGIVQDADLEYDPADFPALVAPILEGKADAVFGSRFAAGHQRRALLFWHGMANKMLTLATNVLNDINLTDMETCYKAVRADILKQIPLKSKRFGFEPELTTRLCQWNIRIYEVPVSYHGRTFAEGKKIGWKDGVAALWQLIKFRFIDTQFTTHEGYYILQSVRKARGFNRWIFANIQKYIGQHVLEAGCGIGNFTEMLISRSRLICADLDDFYVEMISRRFGHLENVKTIKTDLATNELIESIDGEKVDTVICINVMEHIPDDAAVLANFYKLLSPGGHAIILVPAHMWLYSKCDETLGHCKRYSQESLKAALQKAGFEVADVWEFNRLGVYGWWVSKQMQNATLSPRQMKLYERLLPIAKLLDRIKVGPGLSVIGVGRKPDATVKTPAGPTEQSVLQTAS